MPVDATGGQAPRGGASGYYRFVKRLSEGVTGRLAGVGFFTAAVTRKADTIRGKPTGPAVVRPWRESPLCPRSL
jgi:hypothetical protein